MKRELWAQLPAQKRQTEANAKEVQGKMMRFTSPRAIAPFICRFADLQVFRLGRLRMSWR